MAGLISVDAALDLIQDHRLDLPHESQLLADTSGAILAEDLVAGFNQPAFPVSAMDGYAVRFADVEGSNSRLKVIGESPAGAPFDGQVGPGEAVRIFTGGVVPEGADHIVIQEHVTKNGHEINILKPERGPAHVRQAGIDFTAGQTLIPMGTAIGAAEIAVAAAANFASLPVIRRPRVALLANGNELRNPGSSLQKGDVVNANPFALAALIRAWGGVPIDLGIARDNNDHIRDLIAAGHEADVLVPIGGASVGDHDLMQEAIESLGLGRVFSKVAVRPGKPTWFGRLGRQRVLGLPGNPASAFVCAHVFLKPLLLSKRNVSVSYRLGSEIPANGPRETYLRAELSTDETGAGIATPLPNQDSSLLTPFLKAGGLIRRLAHAEMVHAQATVEVIRLG